MSIPTVSPAAYLLGGTLAMAVLDHLFPGPVWIGWPWNLTCLFPAGFGGILISWGISTLSKHQTSAEPFEHPARLVTTGPFRLSRNPMYLGSALLLTSLAIVLGSSTPFLVVPGYGWLLTDRIIKPEEALMWKGFGDEYGVYQVQTRRWI